jgi:hypothetical protein
MYFLRKTFELAVCLLGYWLGGLGGWGGGILLALPVCASSFGWEWLARNVFARASSPGREAFRFGCVNGWS